MKIQFYSLAFLIFMGGVSADVATEKPYYDFFKKLIEKPRPPKRKRVRRQVVKKKQEIVVPPLQIQILGISGEDGARVAIINYKGQQMLIEEGDEKKGEFKVIRIDEGKLVFLHIKAQRRQEVTF
jgi:hypothetical protein